MIKCERQMNNRYMCVIDSSIKQSMGTVIFQELVIFMVTLFLSYLESCFACTTKNTYINCDQERPRCDMKTKK